jgi:hypothetical protein
MQVAVLGVAFLAAYVPLALYAGRWISAGGPVQRRRKRRAHGRQITSSQRTAARTVTRRVIDDKIVPFPELAERRAVERLAA